MHDTTTTSNPPIGSTRHFPPTRAYAIAFVRQHGAKLLFGTAWPHSDDDTIAKLTVMSDREWMRMCGCDHCDDNGICLGHES